MERHPRWARLFLASLNALALTGCAAGMQFTTAVPARPIEDVEATILLVGDAGEPREHSGGRPEPVLLALARVAARAPDRTTIVFLGDNVYNDGVPPNRTDRKRGEAEQHVMLQVAGESVLPIPRAVRRLFVPGNHDWGDYGGHVARNGLERIQAQDSVLSALGAEYPVRLTPASGCAGPDVHDSLSAHVRLVTLDTEWWLQRDSVRRTGCADENAPQTHAAVRDSLRRTLQTAGRRHVIVAAHHPLVSGGPHGGHCPRLNLTWFCLKTKFNVFTRQDIPASVNRAMRDTIVTALREYPPLLYAAGHEHSLQVHAGAAVDSAVRYHVVSGGGIYGHTSPVTCTMGGIVAGRHAGFVQLDVLRDGRIWLTVLTVDVEGRETERSRMQLTSGEIIGRNCGADR